MLRKLHSLPGLFAAVLLLVVALSGVVLSVFPAADRAQAIAATGTDVATVAARVAGRLPGVETLVREPSGTLVAYHLDGQEQRASVVDPSNGNVVGEYRSSEVQRWVKNLHRRLLLGDAGRVAVGVSAACMLLIAISGVLLLARRMGGWKHLFAPLRGNRLQKLHDETARVVLVGLVLSAVTGVLMSLATFGLLPEGGSDAPYPDVHPSAATRLPLGGLPALKAIALDDLRQLKLPSPDDPADVIEVETAEGSGTIDPATGAWLSQTRLDGWQRLHATVRMLHTGEGIWWLGLLLGACALTVPLLAATGTLMWLRRRAALPRLAGNVAAQDADTILLVGSEANTTWGFAVALHDALARAGLRVHTAPMNAVATRYRQARRLIVLTSTHGDGEAPEGAREFLDRLPRLAATPGTSFAVLGFGDRQFPQFCGYGRKVHAALADHGLAPLGDAGTVDRQSEPEFRQWCEWLAQALGVALDVRYQPRLPPTTTLRLVSRTDYGLDPETVTAVLRFEPAEPARRRLPWRSRGLPDFETGDLLGVLAPGGAAPRGAAPRYYSLASAASDGVVEICVRRHPGGACSTYLTQLQPGATIQAFVRRHAAFRPAAGAAPVVLVGAGTGIGPLIGFIRHSAPQRPMHLYFGVRDDDDGFLYRDELRELVGERRLRTLNTAFSRAADKAYVQDRLVADAPRLRELALQGAQVLVCGGRKMAEGVAAAWERILAGSGLSVAQLRAQGRYVEDVY